jgi:HEPN domain-containing protein
MADAGPWLRQARSDLSAAERVLVTEESSTYCQVIAKCQQVVEKCVKSIATELADRGIVSLTIGARGHGVEQFIAAIRRAPRRDHGKAVPEYVREVLERNLQEIRKVMRLAPTGLREGVLPRNTEYPFQDARGILIAPADNGSFRIEEVKQFIALARRIFKQANTLIDVTRRTPL